MNYDRPILALRIKSASVGASEYADGIGLRETNFE